jgi:hypothetical protein
MGTSSGSQTPVQTTQQSDPWSGAQPHLLQSMQSAANLINSNTGYQPYTGPTLADLSPYFTQGWNAAYGLANADAAAGGSAGIRGATDLATNMVQNQGLSPELKSLYEQAKGDQNPYLQSILDTSNRRIGDRINSSMSGAGRYGSGAHTDVMARALGEVADPVLAQDYARRQQQQQDILSGGLQRAGQFAQLMPTLDQAKYSGADMLMGLGQYYNDRAQQQLNSQIQLYNAQQAYPWEQLQRYNAIAAGAGGLGGTKVTTSPSTAAPLSSRIFRGALAGGGLGSMFGAPGAGIGALGGGLLGLLG